MKNSNEYIRIFQPVLDETRLAIQAGALFPGLAAIFSIIDTMAHLYSEKEKQDKKDFIFWVDKYLKTDSDQPYQYTGQDVYGARCGLLHSLAARSEYAEKNNCQLYSYDTSIIDHEVNSRRFKEECRDQQVLISVWRLFLDLEKGMYNFFKEVDEDQFLKDRVNSRKNKIFCTFSYV